MGYTYKVTYKLKTALDAHGEFSHQQFNEELSLISVTDDLGEIFTDLFYLHREDHLMGLEVLSVELWEKTNINELELLFV
ncbi:MAG: hypothetical protein JWO58_49 [Chitinophagaceae bacterium]|nr:hypothetical protein [Chitinophagaceae bacterium]